MLELIETIVRPLQDRIEHLEKQNEELRTQMNTLLTQRSETNRLRSSNFNLIQTPEKKIGYSRRKNARILDLHLRKRRMTSLSGTTAKSINKKKASTNVVSGLVSSSSC